ncbi:hypothetical protein J3E68DRAFT_128011 [Trichoderma sp. SZMC 28012]
MMWREFGEKTPGPLDLVVSDIDLSQALLESSFLSSDSITGCSSFAFSLVRRTGYVKLIPSALSTCNNPSIPTHMATAKACVRCHGKKIRCSGYPRCRTCDKAGVNCEPYTRHRKGDSLLYVQ